MATRRSAYFWLMGTCVVLILLAWNVVRFWSTTAAVAMSVVAAVIPPAAAIVANFGALRESDEASTTGEERFGWGPNGEDRAPGSEGWREPGRPGPDPLRTRRVEGAVGWEQHRGTTPPVVPTGGRSPTATGAHVAAIRAQGPDRGEFPRLARLLG